MSYEVIEHIEVGSGGAASITFSSIPDTYTDLVVKISARSTSDAFQVKFNASTTNFTGRLLQGDGSSVASFSRTDNFVGYINSTSATASTFGNAEISIPNYASSVAKSFTVDGVTENNAASALQTIYAGLWNDTSAISSITIENLSAGFTIQEYSSATLYGITAGSDGTTIVS